MDEELVTQNGVAAEPLSEEVQPQEPAECGTEHGAEKPQTEEGAEHGAEKPQTEEGAEHGAEKPQTECGEHAEGAAQSKPKKKRRWIWNVVLVAVIALGLWSLFGISGEITGEDGMTFCQAMTSLGWQGGLIIAAVVLGVMIIDCLKFVFINKAVIGRVRPGVAIKTSFLGKFYDNVTPLATGGQPMQIYYMTTKGVDVSHSSAVVLIRYFGSIYAFTFIGAVTMIAGVALGVLDGVDSALLLQITGWIGLVVNLIIPVFIAFFVFFPKFALKCTTWFINVGAKLRIVKDKEAALSKALKIVDDFVSSFKLIARHPGCLIAFILCCLAENFLTLTVPFFVMYALGCDMQGMFFTVFALNVFTTFGVSFIPTPGNSGVIEGMGVLAFYVAAGNALAWAVLLWRFAVYYIYILIGVVITIFDLIVKNVKSRRQTK